MATVEEQYAQRQAEAKQTYNERQAENQALYNQRQTEAQNQLNERNTEAQNTYNTRLAESQGKITDLYSKALDAQKQQYQTALDQGIAAQEEARAGIAKSFKTSANDLAIQYERNRRNLNAQALANGLNVGTGSQQQLALNQNYMKSYGALRGEEATQNAGIDRQIANLKVNYQNQIAQAIADNDYKLAASLMEDYNTRVNWLDNQQLANRSYYDNLTLNNQNRLDTNALNNQNYLDTMANANRNWADNENRYQDSQALAKAQTLASYGDFSGYSALGYDETTINAMKQMWINQNPQLAWQMGLIDDATYKRWLEGPQSSGGSGGGGGYYGGGSGGGGSSSNYTGKDKGSAVKAANAFASGYSNGSSNSGSSTPSAINYSTDARFTTKGVR